jgi:UDP-N-acetylglucosamine 2-epimerase (non-hydrolysing)
VAGAKKIMLVAGARPNLMKVVSPLQALLKYPEAFQTRLIHTGQRYNAEMSDVFFRDFQLPAVSL